MALSARARLLWEGEVQEARFVMEKLSQGYDPALLESGGWPNEARAKMVLEVAAELEGLKQALRRAQTVLAVVEVTDGPVPFWQKGGVGHAALQVVTKALKETVAGRREG